MENLIRRFGLVSQDPTDLSGHVLATLPWAEETRAPLARYRDEQPSAEDLSRVDLYQVTPAEMLRTPHLKIRALENELAHTLRHFFVSLEDNLDLENAKKVAYAAGLAHGKRRLSGFLRGQGLTGGPEAMAMWQDTAHASAGPKHTTALFAHYDHDVVEVVRTEDSFGTVGQQSRVIGTYFEGFIAGYKSIDPRLSHIDEFRRERADGKTDYVVRFWYQPNAKA